MTTKTQVIDCHLEHPEWCARQIADHLKCIPEYIHATARRYSIRLPSGKGYKGSARLDQRRSRLRRTLGEAAIRAGLTVERIRLLAS